MKIELSEGATPLELDELNDLIPMHIRTQEALNAWERNNILQAEDWLSRQKDIVSVHSLKLLHTHMFNQTWRWAGKFRTSEKNLGISWHRISAEMKKLCDDVKYQLEYASFPVNEIAVRFHHRLVLIHLFLMEMEDMPA